MAITLPDVHVLFGLARMAEPREQVEPLLWPDALRQREHLLGQRLADRGEQLASEHRHDDAYRQQKAVPDRLPGPVRRQPATGDQAMPVRMQDQRLAPRMQRGNDPGL